MRCQDPRPRDTPAPWVVNRSADGLFEIKLDSPEGRLLASLQPSERAPVDVCLVFPKDQRRCPGVMYRANGTHWTFDTLSRDFTGRPL